MKKILAFAAALMLLNGVTFAQDYKSVPEKEVKVNYVKDFPRSSIWMPRRAVRQWSSAARAARLITTSTPSTAL